MGGAKNFKIKLLAGKTGVSHKCWDSGSNEAFLVHLISVLSYCDCKHYFSKYEKVEKVHCEVEDEVKLCRKILAIEDPLSEDEIEISCEQENLDAALEKEAESMEVELKSSGRFFTFYENLLSNTA